MYVTFDFFSFSRIYRLHCTLHMWFFFLFCSWVCVFSFPCLHAEGFLEFVLQHEYMIQLHIEHGLENSFDGLQFLLHLVWAFEIDYDLRRVT